MAVTVISFGTYKRPPYNPADYPPLKFVKAVKGKPFTGYADIPVLGRWKRLTPANAEEAIDWFAELAAAEIVKQGFPSPLVLVPLPNSSSTVDNGVVPRTAHLAGAIAAKLQRASVWDALRWIERRPPTHQEGSRNPQKLYENLRVVARTVPNGTIVLIDDLYTTGGHVQAAVARLAEKNAKCDFAVCAGRTVLISAEEPFGVVTERLADFTPVR